MLQGNMGPPPWGAIAKVKIGLLPDKAKCLRGYRDGYSGLLWMTWNGRTVESAAATILINSEIGKVCIITVCGGSDIRRWLPLIAQIETYARAEGCKRVRIYGRKGWLHVLDGFAEKHIIMDKELGLMGAGGSGKCECSVQWC